MSQACKRAACRHEELAMNLLVVEDDSQIGQMLALGLTDAGHDCLLVTDGDKGLAEASTGRFDAIILDLVLPGMQGLEVLRRLRHGGVWTPVILLTALGSVPERVAGLNAGADDYMVKPFDFAELAARLDAVSRRGLKAPGTNLSAGDLELDLAARTVRRDGKEVELTPTEARILEMLLRHPGEVITRRMLCEHLWEPDWEGTTNVVEVNINRLRKKLDRENEASVIRTVRGRGYALRTA
jgi:two-component system OmpR family response regulator/two-component system copper resistance phosphate regulon response regulator CusR